MLEHQSLIGRLADQHLNSSQALRDLVSLFVDEITAVLTEHDHNIESFLAAQQTVIQARTL